MLRLFIGFAAILAVLFITLVIVGLCLSGDYTVSRSLVIQAPRQQIHQQLAELPRWDSWSPWKDADPSIQIQVGEPNTGVGAQQSWTGQDGDGRLVFTRCEPDYGIDFDLFFKQDNMQAKASITHEETAANQITVTWSMQGSIDTPVIGGYLALILPDAIGSQFELGLNKLANSVAETQATTTEHATTP